MHSISEFVFVCVFVALADGCFDLFSKTLHILPFVQRINESHAKQLNNIKLSTPEIMFPPLHDEVFDKAG